MFIGLGLQAFALIFGYLCITKIDYIGWLVAYIISIPAFIIGIIFIFYSRIHLAYKFVLGFWILAIPFATESNNWYRKQFIRKEVYLIPQNYRGPVAVDFGVENEKPVTTDDGTVIININSKGQGKTAYTVDAEYMMQEAEKYREYYYVDESGNRAKLIPEKTSPDGDLVVFSNLYYPSKDGKTLSKREIYIGSSKELMEYIKTH